MRRLAFTILLIFFFNHAFADKHVIGGKMRYEYLGAGDEPNTNKYKIILTLYHAPNVDLYDNYQVGIFNGYNYGKIMGNAYPSNNWWIQSDGTEYSVPVVYGPCITEAPTFNYKYKIYTLIVDLLINPYGYTIAYQGCCREIGITNLKKQDLGETYTCNIPGTNGVPSGHDNAPDFNHEMPVLCAHSKFSYDFSITDVDPGESYEYKFLFGYDGGGADTVIYRYTAAPFYAPLEYSLPFTVNHPLGPGVQLDKDNGIMSGIAPDEGVYLVNVWVVATKGLNYITTQRKEMLIRVVNCRTPTAAIAPLGAGAKCDSFNVIFNNAGYNPLGTKYHWDFGDPGSGTANTSSQENTSHLFSTAGDFTVKLYTDVNNGECADSTATIVKVYPGFQPALNVIGKCAYNNVLHFDKTTAAYGAVNSWSWNFGDFTDPLNLSSQQNPVHIYSHPGGFYVQLDVTTDKGCIGHVDTIIRLLDKPPVDITNDTLICIVDTLQLNAKGDGTVLWSPNYMIDNINTATPLVSPNVSTTYHVQFTDLTGCVGSDSVLVKVVDHVNLSLAGDTMICQSDPVQLHAISDALYYEWTPNDGSISNVSIAHPIVRPLINTTYNVHASISKKCYADAAVTIKSIPYPRPNVGPDINVCLGNSTQLHASGAAYYHWSPAIYLTDVNIPDPQVIKPLTGVRYVISARDTLGCPKSVTDTILVKVISIKADAGNDTSVVIGQPLQLHATGGTHYQWDPATWLSSPNIANPVALPQNDIRYTVTVSDDNGCVGNDDILVKYYKLDPGSYLPNAFTPNGDGKNDRFEPIELGLRSLYIFQVYNRWGKLIYQTSDMSKGWDGKLNGQAQETGTYVWYAEGTDYTGKKVKKNGTVILIK